MIALILARGGSKGLPRKNVIPFLGKPLVAHTIEAALDSRFVDRVIVSTDDVEIAEVSKGFGAEVPFMRPAELASDTASAKDVMLHALDYLAAQGAELSTFCLLQPTSPLRTAGDIDAAVQLFEEKKADSVLSVTPYDHPVQWAVSRSDEGRIKPRERVEASRRQDLIECFRPNGALYLFKTAFFRECAGDYIGPNSYGYVMPPERSVDIDTRMDLLVAESVAKYLKEQEDAG